MADNLAVGLTTGGDQSKRRALDFYPTPPDATVALLDFLAPFLSGGRVWEPACGDGAMSRVLEARGFDVVSSDIRHTGYGIGGQDFLTCQPFACEAIITNPPFNVSAEFIERATSLAPLSAMLLKSQYWHAVKRLALFEKSPPAWVLPLTWRPDFLNGERGGSPTMECIWVVWLQGVTDTRYFPLRRPVVKT